MSTPTNIASSMTPSFKMVNKYFIASVVFFFVLCVLLLLHYADIQGHHFQPKLLALTHIATLGWITMIIFGSMYQLVPVVLEVKLFNERIGYIQFWLYCIGVIGLVYGFWFFKVGIHLTISASLVTLAMMLFIFNIAATLAKVTKWNLTGLFILTSIVYLKITAIVGLLLSINLGFPFISRIHLDYLKIHAHLGFLGWVVMVIMGVALKLIPMFGLSHGYPTKPSTFAYIFLNLGLIGIMVEWLFTGSEWLLKFYILLLIIGIFFFLIQLGYIFKHRLRKKSDVSMKHSAVGFVYFFLSTMLGGSMMFITWKDVAISQAIVLVYGFMIMFGFFSMLIVGQMYKIVPFLVWYHTFSDKVGKETVPMLKEMFSERIGEAEFRILNVGLIVIYVGLLTRQPIILLIGFILLLIATVLFTYNIIHIFRIQKQYGNTR